MGLTVFKNMLVHANFSVKWNFVTGNHTKIQTKALVQCKEQYVRRGLGMQYMLDCISLMWQLVYSLAKD